MMHKHNTSLPAVSYRYLQCLQAKVTRSTFYYDIVRDPYYPSILALNETFDKYGIKGAAFSVDPQDIIAFEGPYIAFVFFPERGYDFILVTMISEDGVSFIYDKKRPINISLQQFLSMYRDVIFLAELGESSGERDYPRNLRREKNAWLGKMMWFGGILTLLLLTTIPTADHLSL
jgi:hypothetical protein